MKGSGVKLCAFPAAGPCWQRGVGLLFLGRVGRSSGSEEHPDGMPGISSSATGGGEAARQAAGEEAEEVPAQLWTVLCGTGQLDPGSAVGSREERGRQGGHCQKQLGGLCAVLPPREEPRASRFVSAPVAFVCSVSIRFCCLILLLAFGIFRGAARKKGKELESLDWTYGRSLLQ